MQYNELGQIIKCCPKHESVGCDYDCCKSHPKIKWGKAESLTTIGINTKSDFLALIMFHDNWFRGATLNDLLNSDKIFISFPISETEFIKGNVVPDYTEITTEQDTCFNDIEWLFPRQVTSLYIGNWDMKTAFYNLLPIQQDWYKCRSKVSQRVQNKLQKCQEKLAATNNLLKVTCFCIFVFF